MAAAGRLVSSRRAAKLRGEIRVRTSTRMLALWSDVDVLLTPALSSTAICAGGRPWPRCSGPYSPAGRFTPWTLPFNVTGQHPGRIRL